MKLLKNIIKALVYIVITALVLVGVYFLVNGGGQAFITAIQTSGFPKFVADFFVAIWNGIINLF